MRRLGFALIALCLGMAPALAQSGSDASDSASTSSSDMAGTPDTSNVPGKVATMAELLEDGYEIKASSPSGTDKLIIFMQNEKSAYACEFTNVAKTRCGSIN